MNTPSTLLPASIRVPGSTSNLGAGFDALGLAVDRSFTATYEPGPGPLTLERRGTIEALTTPAEEDLVRRIFADRLGRAGFEPTGRLRVWSDIPVARGLGSSGAAAVAGLALAHAALGLEFDREAALAELERLEGHPDNVAAALLGGLVAISRDADGRARAIRLPLSPTIGFVFAAPGRELSTKAARAALPDTVPTATATRGLGRMAALLHGLATGEPELLRIGFSDELHVPHRLPLIPGGKDALAAAGEAGAWATTISGAGSGLIAACPLDRTEAVAEAMAEAFRRAAGPDGVIHFAVRPDLDGVRAEEVG